MYTTKAKVEAYLGETITASEAQVTEWITAIDKYIEKVTGRVFVADSVASDRLFTGGNYPALLIDDCVSISNVYIGDEYGQSFSEVTSGNFIKFPLNSLPYTKILLKENWGVGIHKIKAKWGYSVACPADITLAATILVAGIANTESTQEVKSESIGDYSITYKDGQQKDYLEAMEILDKYKRYFI